MDPEDCKKVRGPTRRESLKIPMYTSALRWQKKIESWESLESHVVILWREVVDSLDKYGCIVFPPIKRARCGTTCGFVVLIETVY